MKNTQSDQDIEVSSSIPSDILKIQKKLCEFEVGSRNFKKYKKILSKHIKNHNMKKRVNSHSNTIEVIKNFKDLDLSNFKKS